MTNDENSNDLLECKPLSGATSSPFGVDVFSSEKATTLRNETLPCDVFSDLADFF